MSLCRRRELIWRFLEGSRGWFVLCMGCAVASALAGMVTPQIIRVVIDQVIRIAGTEELSPRVRGLLAAAGVGVRKARGHSKHPPA